jgi:D-aminopeptidase
MNRREWIGGLVASVALGQEPRRRAREWGIVNGRMAVGKWNAITDVAGVLVGQQTLIEGAKIRTGLTVILPHGGNLFQQKVRGAVFVGNGFGKLMGSTQVNELGEIESPIALTATLNVARVADGLLDYGLGLPGNEEVRSMNVLVGETNDGRLNDIRARAVNAGHVKAAIAGAKSGPVEEGVVGAGTGTVCFGWKGGIGTSSRVAGAYTVGVLVQSNYGGALRIAGLPWASGRITKSDDGSCMIVIATDAPMEHRELTRLAGRAMWGLGRTGSSGSNGSGDYAIAFSTAREGGVVKEAIVKGDALSPLLEGVIEAVEEAVLNSLFMARTITGSGFRVEALPAGEVVAELKRRGMIAQ